MATTAAALRRGTPFWPGGGGGDHLKQAACQNAAAGPKCAIVFVCVCVYFCSSLAATAWPGLASPSAQVGAIARRKWQKQFSRNDFRV